VRIAGPNLAQCLYNFAAEQMNNKDSDQASIHHPSASKQYHDA
jgi:hypothetical protein